MDAQRRTALIFVTQGVGCASCMCDWGIIDFPLIKLPPETDFFFKEGPRCNPLGNAVAKRCVFADLCT